MIHAFTYNTWYSLFCSPSLRSWPKSNSMGKQKRLFQRGGTLACQVLFYGKVNSFTTLQCLLIGLDIRSDSWVFFFFWSYLVINLINSPYQSSACNLRIFKKYSKEIFLSYSITYHQNAMIFTHHKC